MKILQVNCVYKKGSTGKIVYDIHKCLQQQGIESVVCYGRGQKENEPNVYKTSNEYLAKFNNVKSRFTGLQYNGSFIATNKLINIIEKECPDVVHLHCLNGFFVNIYRLLNYLKNKQIKTVLTLHAEFMHTANCGHAFECEKWKNGCGKCPRLKESTKSLVLDRTNNSWNKMKKSFEGFRNLTIISVSPWLQKRAEQSPILKDKRHLTILNGINTVDFFKPHNAEYLKEKHNLNDEKIILYVTANFDDVTKGGKYIIELAKQLKIQDIKLLIIGNGKIPDNLPNNIIWVGRVEDQKELASYYSLANLCVITSKRETFSMICAESLCCGTPIVGFKAGAPEEITLGQYSDFVEFGDCKGLLEVISKWMRYEGKITRDSINEIHYKYSRETMYKEYETIYRELVNNSL